LRVLVGGAKSDILPPPPDLPIHNVSGRRCNCVVLVFECEVLISFKLLDISRGFVFLGGGGKKSLFAPPTRFRDERGFLARFKVISTYIINAIQDELKDWKKLDSCSSPGGGGNMSLFAPPT